MKRTNYLRTTRRLFFLRAIIWGILAVWYYLYQISPNDLYTPLIIAGLLMINAMIYLFFTVIIGSKKKLIYYTALFFVFANILLTITDQFGIVDTASIILDLAIFLTLLFKPKGFLQIPVK